MNIYDFTTYEKKEILKLLDTQETGLTAAQVIQKQKTFGHNKILKEKVTWYDTLLLQLRTPFVYILLTAAIASLLVDSAINSLVILAIIAINTIIGFYQEYHAQQALLLLKNRLELSTHVLRNNKEETLNNSELVPGDIIILKAGDYIPADVRLIESSNFTVDESALTGETNPAIKDSNPLSSKVTTPYEAKNLGFCGTYVATGYAKAVVVAIGLNTIFGSVNTLSLGTIRKSNYQANIIRLSKFIMWMAIFTIIGLFIFHFVIMPGNLTFFQLTMFSIALAISVIPEALPLVSTFAMSQGALYLAKHHVLVKRLSALEDLGSINLLCTDKTGTLTENILTVKDTYSYQNMDISLLSYLSTVTSGLKKIDPINHAFIDYWNKNNFKKNDIKKEILQHIPFDSVHRFNIVLVHYNGKYQVIAPGVYEEIIKMCNSIDSNDKKTIDLWLAQREQSGLRTIALAYKDVESGYELKQEESNLNFAGFIAMEDPIKPSSYEAINKAKTLGVSIVMLTGDSKEIAFKVAKEIGLTDSMEYVITGNEFQNLTVNQKIDMASKFKVFARITPAQKYEIINILNKDYRVGFLGDGINDAPALRAAHVGIAVSHAADIAQDAADIIILQKNLLVIIDGIKNGRKVFINTIKYVKTTLTSTLGTFYSMTIGTLVINFLPMLPLQILLVNILSDIPMITIATDFIDNQDIQQPTTYNFKDMALTCTIFAIVSSFFDFVIFSLFYRNSPPILQTNWFIFNIFSSLALIFSFRTKLPFYKAKRPSFTLVLFSVLSALIGLLLPYTNFGKDIFKFSQPSSQSLMYIILTAITYFIVTDLLKRLWYNTGIKNYKHKKI